MNFLLSIIRYIHSTIGITTPRPDQERKVVALWVISTIAIVVGVVAFFFLLMSQLR